MRCRICNIFKRKAKDISSPAIQSTEEMSVTDVSQSTEEGIGIVIDDTIIPNSNIEQTVNQDTPSDATDNNKPKVEKTPLKDKVFRFLRLKKLDQYILKKFLGTYFFAILLFLAIVVMFDINEKLDAFLSAPLKETVFDYFFNFLPYFANQFSPLFVFISVIFFTSKMAGNSEIIAILSSGVSFRRLLRPYMIGATVIAAITFVMSNYIIPPTNVDRINYTNKYVKNKKVDIGTNIQLMVEPGVVAYMARYDAPSKMSYRFSLDKFEGKKLVSRLTAQSASYDTLYNWKIRDYMIRDFNGMKESVRRGSSMDTIIPIEPRDFIISKNDQETLTTPELTEYIEKQRMRGVANIKAFEIEKEKRYANTAAAFILTLIGMALSSRKVKGGMGINIGIGLLLSFSYILFSTVTSSFAISGATTPFIAMWIPNVIYLIIGIILYKRASM